MKIERAMKEYLAEIEIRKYSEKTIRGYKGNLSRFLRFVQEELELEEVDDIMPSHIKAYTKVLVDSGHKGTYVNGILKNVKSFLQYCYNEGYGGFNTYGRFKWVKEEKPVITVFESKDIKQMLSACKGSEYLALRDKCIITMLFETGIRCWELCCIKPEDIHEDFILIANGKNHKQRVVPITPILKKAMIKYEICKEKHFMYKTIQEEYFLSFRAKKLTVEAVEHILKTRGKGIEGVRVSPHTCRHFFAQQQVRMGTDVFTISRLLGHENVGITQIYLRTLADKDLIQQAKSQSVLGSI